jgi:hypothetical protein
MVIRWPVARRPQIVVAGHVFAPGVKDFTEFSAVAWAPRRGLADRDDDDDDWYPARSCILVSFAVRVTLYIRVTRI